MYVICRIEPDPLPGNIQEADAAQENHIMELEVSSFHADDEEADNNSSVCEVWIMDIFVATCSVADLDPWNPYHFPGSGFGSI